MTSISFFSTLQKIKIDHNGALIGKHIRMTHHTNINELIVKLMPSVEHQSANLSLVQRFMNEESRTGISFENVLSPIGGATCSGPKKQIQCSTIK